MKRGDTLIYKGKSFAVEEVQNTYFVLTSSIKYEDIVSSRKDILYLGYNARNRYFYFLDKEAYEPEDNSAAVSFLKEW